MVKSNEKIMNYSLFFNNILAELNNLQNLRFIYKYDLTVENFP